MPTYLWTAKNASGAEVAEKVTAPNAQLARELLEKRGHTDLKLIGDDIMAEFTAKNEALANVPAAKRVEWTRKGKITFREYVAKVARDVSFIALACAPLILWRWSRGDYRGAMLFGLVLVCTIAAFAWIRHKPYLFTRMLEAREWHRADETLRLLQRLADVMKPEETSLYRSRALVWKGEFSTALADWRQHESKVSPWLYFSHLSELYEEAGDVDRAIDLIEQSLAHNPNIGALYIDVAWKYLVNERNLPRAKQLTDHAGLLEQSEMAPPFLLRNRGIIALREGRFEEAEKLFLGAIAILDANKGWTFIYSNKMIVKGFLSLARAKLGKLAQARQDFAEAKEWLEAAQVTPLLSACQAELC